MNESERLLEVITSFRDLCIGFATGKTTSFEDYEQSRDRILSEPTLHGSIPVWIIENRYGSQYWSFISSKFATYQGRRNFLLPSFDGLIDLVKTGSFQSVELSFRETLMKVDFDNIESLWRKIHSRRESDPEGVITASKTMLESTLKHILDHFCEAYSEKEDLPELYKKVSKKLNLSPENHTEQIFKQILQGVSSVVIGFSSIRNKYGDAHGKGKNYVGPDKRHADLVVNLSGTICIFLMETFKAHLKK